MPTPCDEMRNLHDLLELPPREFADRLGISVADLNYYVAGFREIPEPLLHVIRLIAGKEKR